MDEESPTEPPSKRHKKHKKKHKHRKEWATKDISGLMSPKTSITLKLKIGQETMGTKNVMSIVQASNGTVADGKMSKLSSGGHNDDDNDDISDEDKWLDALEKGTLDSYGELGKKDPSMLTARQKAILHGSQQDELLQLPSGYKTVELTDEQKKRRQEKAKRRRQQANEKMENDKNQTVHKLLKKQDSKIKRGPKSRGGKRSNTPRIVYKNRWDRITVHLPPEIPFPLVHQIVKPYPKVQMCGVEGCTNKKTSVCSKTNVPICGLECYKKNLASWNLADSAVSAYEVIDVA